MICVMKRKGRKKIGRVTSRLHCQSFPQKFHSYYNERGSSVAFIKRVTNCFLWERSLISSPFYLSLLSIHLYLPLHFPLFLIILILSVWLALSLALWPDIHSSHFSRPRPVFISSCGITLPARVAPVPLASPHPCPVSCHLAVPPSSTPAPRLRPGCAPAAPQRLRCLPSPVSRPSHVSDHSLVFRLPCHHIFHTGPSLNWACIIISYHVEYLITARDERWPPRIHPNRDRHRL